MMIKKIGKHKFEETFLSQLSKLVESIKIHGLQNKILKLDDNFSKKTPTKISPLTG